MIPFLIILIIFFNNIIGRVLPTNLIDEALTALIVLGGCLRILELRKRRSIQKTDIVVVILTAIMVLLGLLSTLVYRHQTGLVPIIKDMMALVKMPLVFAFGSYVFDHLDVDLLYIRTLKLVKASTVIIFICGVLNGVFPMGMDCGYRHGVKTFQFLFSHPTFLVYCLVLFICLLFLEKPFSKYILMNLLSMIFTFRDKAYFFVILYVGIFFFMKLKKKLWRILYVVGGGTAGLAAVYVLSYDKLVNEYLVTEQPEVLFISTGWIRHTTIFHWELDLQPGEHPQRANTIPAYIISIICSIFRGLCRMTSPMRQIPSGLPSIHS